MEFKKIVVCGGGILGSQIAFQSAYCGFDVTILIRKEDSEADVKKKIKNLQKSYEKTIDEMNPKKPNDASWARGISDAKGFNKEACLKRVNLAAKNIKIINEQPIALANADLVIESITENLDIKNAFYKQIAPLLADKTIVVTNSSTILPSKMAKATGRPEKFLAMHFANVIWKNNIAEIMGHDKTAADNFDRVVKFADAIRMIPLEAREEKAGYLLNSMLVPFLLCAMDLVANGVADPETIDKAWTLGTGAPHGPFQILDTVGLVTAKNIVLQYQKVPNLFDPLLKKMMMPYNFDGMLRVLDKYVNAGKLGKASGEGFYKYN
ncbi:MAG: 3-hydroxyacyl-CoA dehydrogenase [Clostridia bacterium]|nr:3-hydroxyacyl-CoA dehydrogenase [Clostridia bacterium]